MERSVTADKRSSANGRLPATLASSRCYNEPTERRQWQGGRPDSLSRIAAREGDKPVAVQSLAAAPVGRSLPLASVRDMAAPPAMLALKVTPYGRDGVLLPISAAATLAELRAAIPRSEPSLANASFRILRLGRELRDELATLASVPLADGDEIILLLTAPAKGSLVSASPAAALPAPTTAGQPPRLLAEDAAHAPSPIEHVSVLGPSVEVGFLAYLRASLSFSF